jgi:hypothetical protein
MSGAQMRKALHEGAVDPAIRAMSAHGDLGQTGEYALPSCPKRPGALIPFVRFVPPLRAPFEQYREGAGGWITPRLP